MSFPDGLSSEASLQRLGRKMAIFFFSNAQYSTKVIRHTKKQGNQAHSKEQNKSPETHPKKTQVWHLHDKDFKTAFLNMLKVNMDRHLNEIRKTICKQSEIINKIEIIKKSQTNSEA